MKPINYQKNIQATPNFEGRIAFIKRVQIDETGQVLFRHLKRGKKKALKPLTRYLKYNTKGAYGIGVNEEFNQVFVTSSIENTRCFKVPAFTRRNVEVIVQSIRPDFLPTKNKKGLFENFSKGVNKFKMLLLCSSDECKKFFENIIFG